MNRNLSWLEQPYQLNEELSFNLWQDETAYGKCYYVSPDGDDSAAGSLDHPFRTVKKPMSWCSPGKR